MRREETTRNYFDFSLVRGGPAYRFLVWAGLRNEQLKPAYGRVFLIAAIAWLPLLLLSLIEGHAVSNAAVPFLYDIETHVRFLVALPFFLVCETIVQKILGWRVSEFVTRNIIRESDRPKFAAAVESAHRMRDSVLNEVILLVLVYAAGIYFYTKLMISSTPSWFAQPDQQMWHPTMAGLWVAFVSVPIFQFIVFRWFYRIAIWSIFLFRVSRLDLNLLPTHPDFTSGIGFLGQCAFSFSYFLIGQACLVSAWIAGRVLHDGADPTGFRFEVAAAVVVLLLIVLGPFLVFSPKLLEAKWKWTEVYNSLGSEYIQDFHNKWITNRDPDGEPLLGSGDIQSLADLTNGLSVINRSRLTPFSLNDLLYMAAMTLLPLLPLTLFIFSVEDLLRILKDMFF